MKKRTRNIEVHNQSFIWACDEKLWLVSELKILGNRIKTRRMIEMKFESTETITPAIVRKIIDNFGIFEERIDSDINTIKRILPVNGVR